LDWCIEYARELKQENADLRYAVNQCDRLLAHSQEMNHELLEVAAKTGQRAKKAEADAHREIYERGYRVGIELSAKLCDAAASWKIPDGESVSGGMSHTLQAIQYLGISIRALLTAPTVTTEEGD
jgi:hypothetical protein